MKIMFTSQAEIYCGIDVGYVGVSLVLRNYVWRASLLCRIMLDHSWQSFVTETEPKT